MSTKYLYFYIFRTLFQLISILPTCLEFFIYSISWIFFVFIRGCLRTVCTIRTRCRNREKAPPVFVTLSRNTNYSLQLDKPLETATMKQSRKKRNRYSPSSVVTGNVSLKKISLYVCCVALYEIYTSIPARGTRKFFTHKRTQRIRACRRFNRSPLDEPAMHIKQESQSPEGGKHTRLIKRELPDGPIEQETEEDQTDDREYSESHGHDSGQDEDIAEDLSMAPDIMIPEDQVEA